MSGGLSFIWAMRAAAQETAPQIALGKLLQTGRGKG